MPKPRKQEVSKEETEHVRTVVQSKNRHDWVARLEVPGPDGHVTRSQVVRVGRISNLVTPSPE